MFMGLLTRHCHLNGQLCKMGLVDSPGCGTFKQTFETASYVLCDCETLPALRFRHLSQHFMKHGDVEDVSVSRILHFVQSAGLLNA